MRTLTAEARTSTAHCLGNDRLLFGMILGVLAFWLFAQTILNISPTMAADLSIQMSVMNIAVSITALFSGIFIVVIGGLADRVGRVRHWQGAGRQRAVSLWSMGSWGGSGFAALFGGLIAQNIGWRWIFFASVAVSVIGMIAMVALQVLATQGAKFGWTSAISLALLAAAIVFGVIFFRTESGNPRAFVDFRLFRNLTYTGATLSRSFDSAADADVPAARYLQDPGDRCVHVFRHRAGVLRDPIHRRGAREFTGRPGLALDRASTRWLHRWVHPSALLFPPQSLPPSVRTIRRWTGLPV